MTNETEQTNNNIEIPLNYFSRVAIDVLKKNFEFVTESPVIFEDGDHERIQKSTDVSHFGKPFYIEDKEVKITQLLKKAFKNMKKERPEGKRIYLYKAYLVPTIDNNKKYSVSIRYYI